MGALIDADIRGSVKVRERQGRIADAQLRRG
jgi:hypothetical protein